MERELEELATAPSAQREKQQPKRQALPAHLPRRSIRHEPESTTCACGCTLQRISEDVAEKLDYRLGVFSVERHVRGKWVCTKCETLVQAPVARTSSTSASRRQGCSRRCWWASAWIICRCTGRKPSLVAPASPRSTLASRVGQCGVQLQPLVDALKREMLKDRVLHADDTPVAMLKPGNAKTHRAYVWSYCTTSNSALRAVVFDFADTRGGQHARTFLGLLGEHGWRGTLVCDDFSGSKACFELGVIEAGCLAHARRKFHELWANHGSPIGEQALKFFGGLYAVEREVAELMPDDRRRIRQEKSRKVADAMQQWLTGNTRGCRMVRPRPERSTTA